jgi:HD superfamily phosphohydrolase
MLKNCFAIHMDYIRSFIMAVHSATFTPVELNSFDLETQMRIFNAYTSPFPDVTNCTEEEAKQAFIPTMEKITEWLKNLHDASYYMDNSSYFAQTDKITDEKYERLLKRIQSNAASANTYYRSIDQAKLKDKTYSAINNWVSEVKTAVVKTIANRKSDTAVTQPDAKPEKTRPIAQFSTAQLRSLDLEQQKAIFSALTAPAKENGAQEEVIEKCISSMEDMLVWLNNLQNVNYITPLPKNAKAKLNTLIDRVKDHTWQAKSAISGKASGFVQKLNQETYTQIIKWLAEVKDKVANLEKMN